MNLSDKKLILAILNGIDCKLSGQCRIIQKLAQDIKNQEKSKKYVVIG